MTFTFTLTQKAHVRAVQAGRELRVLVNPDELTDQQAHALARNIALKIENDLQYPGQIRITIRTSGDTSPH